MSCATLCCFDSVVGSGTSEPSAHGFEAASSSSCKEMLSAKGKSHPQLTCFFRSLAICVSASVISRSIRLMLCTSSSFVDLNGDSSCRTSSFGRVGEMASTCGVYAVCSTYFRSQSLDGQDSAEYYTFFPISCMSRVSMCSGWCREGFCSTMSRGRLGTESPSDSKAW